MADNVAITAGSGTTVSTEEVTNLNGGAVSAQHVQRMLAAIRTADGTAIDLPGDATNGLDVDVTRSALPTGASTAANQTTIIGAVDGIEAQLTTLAGLVDGLEGFTDGIEALLSAVRTAVEGATPAGGNEIGGVNVTRLAGTAVDVNTGRASAGSQRVVIATDQAQLTNAWKVDGSAVTQPVSGNVGMAPQTRGGLSIARFIDLDEADQAVKGTAGQLYGWLMTNHATTSRFVKFYNDTTANITVGTSTPVMTFELPAGAASHIEFANGIAFSAAITVAATTAVADADRGAPGPNDVVANFFYA